MRKYRKGSFSLSTEIDRFISFHVLKSQLLLPVRWNVGVEGHRRSTAVAGLVEHTGWKAIWNFQHRNHTQILSVCSLPSKASDFLHVDYMSVLKGNSSWQSRAWWVSNLQFGIQLVNEYAQGSSLRSLHMHILLGDGFDQRWLGNNVFSV